IAGGRGRRALVNRPTLSQSFEQHVSFSVWAARAGHTPGARTLELARRPASAAVAAALELKRGAQVYEYQRLRLLDGEPAMIEVAAFIEPVGRLLMDFDLDVGSVYEQLAERGIEFAEAHQTISATAATSSQAELLAVPRRSPLLEVRRHVFDPAGTPIELSYDSYRGDTFTVSLHNRVSVERAGVSLSASGG
ncbi:MAG: UTRA domain-containing protein, partial [Solirubrobacterales bacterium]|nr:UTRA domain-containing protein [Solirubrobacterales bacterium]